MKLTIWNVIPVLAFVSCEYNRPTDYKQESEEPAVSIAADSLIEENKDITSLTPDGLFDDFIYSFMNNPPFQKERIVFPLPNYINGTNHPIKSNKLWKHDYLYLKEDIYTLIFDNESSIKAEKDTSIHHVELEWVYLDKERIKQYKFDKIKGYWFLTAIDSHPISDNPNKDFYKFYKTFSKDVDFQQKHVSDPFYFKTYDSDNFQYIEGLLDRNQWQDYHPNLPKGVITNVNYCQNYTESDHRVLLICSPSGGMGCSLTFIKKGDRWMLEKLEN